MTDRSTAQSPAAAEQNAPAIRWERASCAVCGAASSRFVVDACHPIHWPHIPSPGAPASAPVVGSARIVRCTRCGHLYQDPRPTPDTIAMCYGDSYGPHAPSPATVAIPAASSSPATPSPLAKRPWYLGLRRIPGLRALYGWLSDSHAAPVPQPPQPQARALEFGCGSGRYLDQLRAAGWQVEGIEPAAEPARRCRERGLSVTTGGIEDAALAPAAYDLVVAWMVLEHLHEPAAVLRQVHRLLKPGGTLLLSVPNAACWETPFFGRYHFVFNEPTHLHHFSPEGIRNLLIQNGYQVCELHFQQNLYNVIGSLGLWLRARFPRHSLGSRLLAFCDQPAMGWRLLLAPIAKALAAVGQGGRMTIVAQPQADQVTGNAALTTRSNDCP